MRIFDWVLGGLDVHVDIAPAGADSMLVKCEPAPYRKMMNEFVRVVADNAAEYVNEQFINTGKPYSYDALGGRSVYTPRFEHMWLEHRVFASSGVPGWQMLNFGLCVASEQLKDGQRVVMGPCLSHDRINGKEVVTAYPYTWGITLDDQGFAIDAVSGSGNIANSEVLTVVPLVALDWMNGRNLQLVKHQPSTSQQRHWRKRNMIRGNAYYQIEIGGGGYREQWERQSKGVSASRFHIVAGSWATYTDDKPRFGRRRPEDIGRFWRRSSGKGDKSLGVINKEYHVTAEAVEQ